MTGQRRQQALEPPPCVGSLRLASTTRSPKQEALDFEHIRRWYAYSRCSVFRGRVRGRLVLHKPLLPEDNS